MIPNLPPLSAYLQAIKEAHQGQVAHRGHIKYSNIFRDAWEQFRHDPKLADLLRAFQQHKQENPLARFGSKDYPFIGGGPLHGYLHAGLTRDLSIIYTVAGSPPTIYIYTVGGHNELGTGTPPNPRKLKQTAQKLKQARFD